MGRYGAYAREIAAMGEAGSAFLARTVGEWMELDDSVASAIMSDPSAAGAWEARYWAVRDSIQDALVGLVGTATRSLGDYLDLATVISAGFGLDSAALSCKAALSRLFDSMDSIEVRSPGAAEAVRGYEDMLLAARRRGLGTRDDLRAFLVREDLAFRSFLSRLAECGDVPLAGLRDASSGAMDMMLGLAGGGAVPWGELAIVIAMRTNRRIIQNAVQCAQDVRDGRMRPGGVDGQADAYMWMLMQPWMAIDARSMALLTEGQLAQMLFLAGVTVECAGRLGNTAFPVDPGDVPALLMRSAIMGL